MMGFKDRTWCPKSINQYCARKEGCYRAFTEQDQKDAEEWWGDADFPICVYRQKPDCFVPIRGYAADGSE